ncbi:UDP-glycosyltransferase 91A1-like [Ziziphus jujuba]|uniref:UDP-glycosyltransferase 91A1-like n=1 Tax=Ziziphus jujuba TaxID=326968 RepID=A0A6P4A9E0_ZIZJJ|nr:UDP-glycosyltransferase 91A1-like [Ziziphus jujuba]
MANREDKLHIAMFPWLAFGHMIPYLELAKLIAQKGHCISFISTPRNIDRLPRLPPNLSPFINFIKLPLPHQKNLPPNAEATTDLPLDKVPFLKKAYDSLLESITHFLQSSNPDWLLYDFAAYWLPDIARNLGIPNANFSIFIAAALSFVGPTSVPDYRKEPEEFAVPPKWVPFPTTVAFRLFEVLKLAGELNGEDDDNDNVSAVERIKETLGGCDVIAVRGCMEFEPEWIHLLEDINRKPVLQVGMLPTRPTINDDDIDNDDYHKWKPMKEWLDLQKAGSVVYVAFGSEAEHSQAELNEIALGLELSELPFFWVLRSTRTYGSTRLPDGFEERTRGHGFVCKSWAPQVNILGHDSVGGFLTHAGWSSVVESLQFGRPLVLLTYSNDQGINAKVLEEKMIGHIIERDERDGSFTREAVAESLKLVVVKEEGKIYRDKAKEMKPLFSDMDLQEKYVDNFLDYLITHRQRPKVEDEKVI